MPVEKENGWCNDVNAGGWFTFLDDDALKLRM